MPKPGLQKPGLQTTELRQNPGKGFVCPERTQDLQLEDDLWKHVDTQHTPLEKTFSRDAAYVGSQYCMRSRQNGSCNDPHICTNSYGSGMSQ